MGAVVVDDALKVATFETVIEDVELFKECALCCCSCGSFIVLPILQGLNPWLPTYTQWLLA